MTSSAPAETETKSINEASAPFAHGAIRIVLQADPDLNALNGLANSSQLLIAQAEKESTLRTLLNNTPGLKTIFNQGAPSDGILKVDRYAAMPGQKVTLHIDRTENSRYVALIAGYYPFPDLRHMVLVKIPMRAERKNWWRAHQAAQLLPVTLDLRLGSNSISSFSGANPLSLAVASPTEASAQSGHPIEEE